MFYDSHCHLCKLGVSSAGATKSRRATKADPWPLLLRRSGANFPPNPALWLPRGLNFLCHGLGGSRIPKSPAHSMSARWLWATCFMISGGDLLSFDLKSSGQDTHQYMWLVIVSWRHGVIYSFGRDLRRPMANGWGSRGLGVPGPRSQIRGS